MKKNKCPDCSKLGRHCDYHFSRQPLHLQVAEVIIEAMDSFDNGPRLLRGKPIPKGSEILRRQRVVYVDKRKNGKRVKVELSPLGDRYTRRVCNCNCGRIRHDYYVYMGRGQKPHQKLISRFIKILSKRIKSEFGLEIQYIHGMIPCVAVLVPYPDGTPIKEPNDSFNQTHGIS